MAKESSNFNLGFQEFGGFLQNIASSHTTSHVPQHQYSYDGHIEYMHGDENVPGGGGIHAIKISVAIIPLSLRSGGPSFNLAQDPTYNLRNSQAARPPMASSQSGHTSSDVTQCQICKKRRHRSS
ncbi:Uncharacterized protein Fot_41910 [Forsythia ovata]|uniref:Uncharacterized protein n=1 Tax=Forsythia ovata TaxID=205694 RepID=A0ABD1RLI0_9LAMI